MDDLLVGILALVFGAAVCFLGLRVWFAMLPIWGFISGFFVGAASVTAIFGDGFLSTVTGWVFGVVVGVLFALFSYFIWYIGAILVAGSVGALFGSGIMRAIGVDSDWAIFLVALAGAIVAVVLAMFLALPAYIVIANTAFAGATAMVTGAMLVLDRIELADLQRGSAWAMIQASWFWVLAWMVVFVLGLGFQLRSIDEVVLPESRRSRANPTSTRSDASESYAL